MKVRIDIKYVLFNGANDSFKEEEIFNDTFGDYSVCKKYISDWLSIIPNRICDCITDYYIINAVIINDSFGYDNGLDFYSVSGSWFIDKAGTRCMGENIFNK